MEIKELLLVEQNFKRVKKIKKDLNINIKYDSKNNESGKDLFSEFIVNLRAMQGDEEAFRLGIKMVGIFDIEEIPVEKETFKKDMVPKIMFGYIKKKIESVFSEAGLPKVKLPPISQLKNKEKAKQKKKF
ncbi:MAG: protein-export chaperone SecB [Fusobacteriota bacterium]